MKNLKILFGMFFTLLTITATSQRYYFDNNNSKNYYLDMSKSENDCQLMGLEGNKTSLFKISTKENTITILYSFLDSCKSCEESLVDLDQMCSFLEEKKKELANKLDLNINTKIQFVLIISEVSISRAKKINQFFKEEMHEKEYLLFVRTKDYASKFAKEFINGKYVPLFMIVENMGSGNFIRHQFGKPNPRYLEGDRNVFDGGKLLTFAEWIEKNSLSVKEKLWEVIQPIILENVGLNLKMNKKENDIIILDVNKEFSQFNGDKYGRGEYFSFSKYAKSKPNTIFVINFWSRGCSPCELYLNNVDETSKEINKMVSEMLGDNKLRIEFVPIMCGWKEDAYNPNSKSHSYARDFKSRKRASGEIKGSYNFFTGRYIGQQLHKQFSGCYFPLYAIIDNTDPSKGPVVHYTSSSFEMPTLIRGTGSYLPNVIENLKIPIKHIVQNSQQK
jgi:thiol-disulfide isomerase/thioredoxin